MEERWTVIVFLLLSTGHVFDSHLGDIFISISYKNNICYSESYRTNSRSTIKMLVIIYLFFLLYCVSFPHGPQWS